MSRKRVRRSVAKRQFKKAAAKTEVHNLPSKHNMMRGGFHF